MIFLLLLLFDECRVCTKTVATVETQQIFVISWSTRSYHCGLFYLETCYRTVYHQNPVIHSYTIYHTKRVCCEGYLENDEEQCFPICSDCPDTHFCLVPYTCVCPVDWIEDNCTGPPQNATLTATGPTSLQFSWKPPVQEHGEFNTTQYIVLFENATYTVNPSSNLTIKLDALIPFTKYNCCVAANTTSGPSRLACATQTTPRIGAVEHLNVVAVHDNILHVSWDPPLSPRGVLTGYKILVKNLIDFGESVYSVSVYVYELNITLGIYPYVRYDIVVSAVTTGGLSDSAHAVAYSREGTPQSSPPNTTSSRHSATTATVEWDEMSWEDLRGWLVSYEIGYESVRSDQCPANDSTNNETVSVEGEMYGVSGLDPGLQYCVWVAGRTSAGVGPFSHTHIPWSTNNEFTVKFETVDCNYFIVREVDKTTEDLAREISRGIELFCQCSFSSDYIADRSVSCSKHILVFQGRLISTSEKNSSSLLYYLEKWIASGSTVLVRGEQLHVVQNDSEVVSGNQKTEQFPFPLVAVPAGILAIVSFIIGIVIAVVVRLKLKQGKIPTSMSHTALNIEEDNDRIYDRISIDGCQGEQEQSPDDREMMQTDFSKTAIEASYEEMASIAGRLKHEDSYEGLNQEIPAYAGRTEMKKQAYENIGQGVVESRESSTAGHGSTDVISVEVDDNTVELLDEKEESLYVQMT